MKIKTYNKLVRDNIPEIIREGGGECVTEVLSDGKKRISARKSIKFFVSLPKTPTPYGDGSDVMCISTPAARVFFIAKNSFLFLFVYFFQKQFF